MIIFDEKKAIEFQNTMFKHKLSEKKMARLIKQCEDMAGQEARVLEPGAYARDNGSLTFYNYVRWEVTGKSGAFYTIDPIIDDSRPPFLVDVEKGDHAKG